MSGLCQPERYPDCYLLRYPSAQLHVDYLRPQEIYEALLADQADLGLVSYPEPTKELAVIPWREEGMVVATLVSHPLARKAVLRPGRSRRI